MLSRDFTRRNSVETDSLKLMKKQDNLPIALSSLRNEIIGRCYKFPTPFGDRFMTYADYTASGRNLRFIEEYLLTIQESYANTHTEDDVTGKSTTELLHRAERKIKQAVNGNETTCIIAAGTGATGAIIKLQQILGVYIPSATQDRLLTSLRHFSERDLTPDEAAAFDKLSDRFKEYFDSYRPVVFVSRYEHHSNEVTWRESLAEVVAIGFNDEGGLNTKELERQVSDPKYDGRLKIGSFSAASNVTGMLTPVHEVASILHRHGGIVCFDFAASGPYVEINMNKDNESYFDAVFLSPHKFLGGPGASGLLLINDKIYRRDLPPTCGGGGTVDYVGPHAHDYSVDIETREKAGTPGVLQIFRAALVIELKNIIGIDTIEQRERDFSRKVLKRFIANPKLNVLGSHDPDKRIPIISFNVRHEDRILHPKFVTRLLNDLFGIQSRAGCSCAGPYGHHLLNIDLDLSEKYRKQINDGYEGIKPGWVRIGFHYTLEDSDVEFICEAVEFAAEHGHLFLPQYHFDLKTGAWEHTADTGIEEHQFGVVEAMQSRNAGVLEMTECDREREYSSYLETARQLAEKLQGSKVNYKQLPEQLEEISFFHTVNYS